MLRDANYPRSLVSAALDEYGLTGVRVEPIRVFNNAVFRVTTPSGDLALRIHRPGYRTSTQIRSELVYLAGLAATGLIEVPAPLSTRHGDLVAQIDTGDEARHCSVVTWLPGRVRRPGTGAGPATLFRIGETLGWMHSFSESFKPQPAFDRPVWDLEAVLDRGDASPLGEGRHLIDEVRERSEALFGGIARAPTDHGVIHNDFILLNCLHRGRRTAVIDFDDCGWGFFLQDLGGLLGNLKDYPNYRSLWKPFLDGYRSVRPLPSEREDDLELMVALRHAATALWMIDRDRQQPLPGDQLRENLDHRLEEIERSLREMTL